MDTGELLGYKDQRPWPDPATTKVECRAVDTIDVVVVLPLFQILIDLPIV